MCLDRVWKHSGKIHRADLPGTYLTFTDLIFTIIPIISLDISFLADFGYLKPSGYSDKSDYTVFNCVSRWHLVSQILHTATCFLWLIFPIWDKQTLKIVVRHSTRPRKVPRSPEIGITIVPVSQSPKLSCRAHAADTNAIAHTPGIRLADNAAFVREIVRLNAIRETEVAKVAAGFNAGDAVIEIVWGARAAGAEAVGEGRGEAGDGGCAGWERARN